MNAQKYAPSRPIFLPVAKLRRVGILALPLVLLLVLPISGCNRADNSAAAAGLNVTLIPEATYPGSTMRIEIEDEAGEPVTDVTVSLEGNMTHAGMAPVLTESVWDGADGAEDGAYHVPFRFNMLGDWIITVKIERREGDPLKEDIDLVVTSEGVAVVED